jgi:hypothetical protein
MCTTLRVLVITLIGLFMRTAPTAAATGPDDAVRVRIDESLAPHPRLLLTQARLEEIKRAIAADPTLDAVWQIARAQADRALEAPPLERRLEGRRLLAVSRECLGRVMHLAFAYRVTGERKYLDGAVRQMVTVAAFEDWNPSHFLDVAEMTAALAIGYDWLGDKLNEADAKTIRDAIVAKGLQPSFAGKQSWIRGTNNWNQVCHGGLVMGALAIAEAEPALAAQVVARALDGVPQAMKEYAPDGAYPEGPGYWAYGTTYNVLLLASLESALGTDFGLLQTPGFLATADYYLHVTGPTLLYFNYSDCGQRREPAPAMYWLAGRRQQPALLFNEEQLRVRMTRRAETKRDSEMGRFGPLLLIWATPAADVERPAATHWVGHGRNPVAMHRSSWDPEATYVAIKGGSPSVNHGHMDVGTFVLDALGVRWAEDLGMQSYESLESRGLQLWDRAQESDRWSVFRIGSLSHNVLTVDGRHQRVSGDAAIVQSGEHGTIVDLTPVYDGQLAEARRGVQLRADRSVLVQDEIRSLAATGAAPLTRVRWAMLTGAEVALEKDGSSAVLKRDGKTLLMRAVSPDKVKLQTYSTDPPKEHDAPNPGTRMVGFEVVLAPGQELRLAVELIPGGTAGAPAAIAPLSSW